MQAILGIVLLVGFAWLVSEARRDIVWRYVWIGLGLQFLLAFVFIQVEWVANSLLLLNGLVEQIEAATSAGTSFLFGYLGGGEFPFEVSKPNATYLFAFRVLPQVVVFSAIIAILWYWRILPMVVRASWLAVTTHSGCEWGAGYLRSSHFVSGYGGDTTRCACLSARNVPLRVLLHDDIWDVDSCRFGHGPLCQYSE